MPSGPNDVLVSSTLRNLVIGSGLEFEDRGAHELKGVPGDWHLFAVGRLGTAGRGNRLAELRSPRLVGLGRGMDSVLDPQALVGLLGVKLLQIDEFGAVRRGLVDQHLVVGRALRSAVVADVVLTLGRAEPFVLREDDDAGADLSLHPEPT